MKRFDAKNIAKRMGDFSRAKALFAAAADGCKFDQAEATSEFKKALVKAQSASEAVGFDNSVSHFGRILRLLQKPQESAALAAYADQAEHALRTDLSNRKFLHVPSSLTDCLENERLLGQVAWNKFPDARPDILEAGNCLAADCNTAAVFHLIRVSEHGLRALAGEVGVTLTDKGQPLPIEHAAWNRVITATKNKIAEAHKLPGGPTKVAQLEFFSSAADQCEYIKDIWRNTISHARQHFNGHDALSVKGRVQDFMDRLARGLP